MRSAAHWGRNAPEGGKSSCSPSALPTLFCRFASARSVLEAKRQQQTRKMSSLATGGRVVCAQGVRSLKPRGCARKT